MLNLDNTNRFTNIILSLSILSLTLNLIFVEHTARWGNRPLIGPRPESIPLDPPFPVVSLEQAVEHLKNGDAMFFDARPVKDYQFAHIPGATSVPASAEIASSKLEEFRKSKLKLIIYCGGASCEASHQLAARLRDYQIDKVHIFEGGFFEWTRARMPVQKT